MSVRISCLISGFALIALTAVTSTSYSADEPYTEPKVEEADLQHWSFQPILSSDIPKGAEHPVDAFLLKRMRKETEVTGFAPNADAATLLRRLTFALTGLPPTARQGTDFATLGFKAFVDQLLESPHYGERQAQHWLDLARFAETDGFEHDKTRSESWRFRDWVVDAYNRDIPYDQFLSLQIAGDELAPGDEREKAATGFLFAGPDMPDINLEAERRHSILNEITGTVGSAFLGMTMACCQCHDHKTDPISHADFFEMRAFFENLKIPEKNKSLPHLVSEKGPRQPDSFLYARGDFRSPGMKLQPAFLPLANPGELKPSPAPGSHTSGYRTELANWLVSPGNPLTARVIVNRLWMQAFGTPLVATPSDFGKTGASPSHPELLDWLAAEFVKEGWSIKSFYRLLLTSQTWKQSSRQLEGDDQWSIRLLNDPKNTCLTRFPRRRLSGEEIRDAMLLLTGSLNTKTGGPGVRPPLPAEITVTLLKNQWPVTEDKSEHSRRSIYLFVRRNLRFPIFEVFDRPDGNASCARRHLSTTAPQSLILLNSDFSRRMAKQIADEIDSESSKGIQFAWTRILGHPPMEQELKLAEQFLKENPDGGLSSLCLALFNSNEFVWLD